MKHGVDVKECVCVRILKLNHQGGDFWCTEDLVLEAEEIQPLTMFMYQLPSKEWNGTRSDTWSENCETDDVDLVYRHVYVIKTNLEVI